MVWCDPREAFDADALGWPVEIFLEGQAVAELDNIWWPNVEFPNSSGGRELENIEFIVFPDGTIEYEERFRAQLEAHYDLRQFPFDTQ